MQEHSGSVDTLANRMTDFALRAMRCPDQQVSLPARLSEFATAIRTHDRQQGELADAARRSVLSGENESNIGTIAEDAYEHASRQFLLHIKADTSLHMAALVLNIESSAKRHLFTAPSILSLVLQEWFYNSIKAVRGSPHGQIRVALTCRRSWFCLRSHWWLQIETPTAVPATDLATFRKRPLSWNEIVADVSQLRGLTLIRNVCYWGLTRTPLRCFHAWPGGQQLTDVSDSPAAGMAQILEIQMPRGLVREV